MVHLLFTKEVVKHEYIRSVNYNINIRIIHSGFTIFDNSDYFKEKIAKLYGCFGAEITQLLPSNLPYNGDSVSQLHLSVDFLLPNVL